MVDLDHNLLGNLYATIEQEEGWLPLLNELKRHFQVESAVAQILAARSDYMQQLWTARDCQSQNRAGLHDSWANSDANPRFRRPRSDSPFPQVGSDFRNLQLAPTELLNMRKGLAGCGLGTGFWIDIKLEPNTYFALVFHRLPGDDRDLSEEEEAKLMALIPHLHRTLRVRRRLIASEDMASVLDLATCATDTAMMVCDSHLRIKWANPPGLDMARTSRHLDSSNGILRGARVADTGRLRDAVMAAANGEDSVMAMGSHGEDMVHVRALPVGMTAPTALGIEQFGPGHVLLLLSAPERVARLDPDRLAQAFALTPAEARLAAMLSEGHSLADFAARRGITTGTARIQLKSIMAKTGTSRQADLVRLITASCAARDVAKAGLPTLGSSRHLKN